MAGRKRKHIEEEHVNHERWMVTYADMLTLLLVLFIVLYAISSVNTDKFAQLKASLSNAFGNGQSPVLNGGTGPIDGSSIVQQQKSLSASSINNAGASSLNKAAAQFRLASNADAAAAAKEVDQFTKIKSAVQSSLAQRGLAGTASFAIDERGLVVTLITDDLVFGGNSAVLEPEGQIIVSAVSPALARIDNQLQVDGHTNQQNVSTAPYPSGWELSSARASAVVRYLISHDHISAGRLSAVGYSDQKPLFSPKDPRSVTRNRRVDIVILSKLPASAKSNLAAIGKASMTSSGG